MMPTRSQSNELSRDELWTQPRPLWLWDVAERRIAWANQACLLFSGAATVEDLTRLKFPSNSAFTKQLAALAKTDLGPKGTRELIRFLNGNPKANEEEYVFDCRVLNREVEPGRSGLLVELVADRGKTLRVKTRKRSKKPSALPHPLLL